MIHISMCWLGKDWRGHMNAHNYPIISRGPVSLGLLILHGAGRNPDDAVYTVETIGL